MNIPAAPRRAPANDPALAAILNRYRQFVLTVGLFAALTVAFYTYAYSQFRQTQFILVPAVITMLVLSSPIIFWMVRRGHTLLAGSLVLLGLAFAYAGNEAAWTGLSVYHIIGGVLLVLIAGSFILPRRVTVWVAVSFAYLGLLWAINVLPILQPVRINHESFPLMLPFSLGSNILLALAFIAQVLVEFQTRSLRTRLLVIFIVLTFIPVAAITVISGILSSTGAQQQAMSHLETIGTLKEREIENWLDSLQHSLGLIELDESLSSQIVDLLTTAPTDSAWRPLYSAVQGQLDRTRSVEGHFTALFLVDLSGDIILSTDPAHEGVNESGSAYFAGALQAPLHTPVLDSQTFGAQSVIFARPVTTDGRTVGVLGGLANLEHLAEVVAISAAMGSTGEVYVVGENGVLLTPTRAEAYPAGATIASQTSATVLARGRQGESLRSVGSYLDYRGVPVVGYYHWLDSLQAALFAEQDQNEALGSAFSTLGWSAALSTIFVVLAFVAGTLVAGRITGPLASLSGTAAKVAEGNLDLSVDDTLVTEQLDEIGDLARSFNKMTGQLRLLFSDMEARVAERTADLERRSAQLQIAAEVARDATAVRDLDELLKRSVNLLRERFLYYHAGIFLVDERGEYAILAAATGDAGRKMLARGHRLKVGETGMVGYVTRTGQPRVAGDVSADPAHYDNPDLPDTRSEAALPLRVGTTTIGAVDVQSINLDAFSPEVMSVLQIVTDQLAVAISSARLVRQLQETLRQVEVVYGDYTRKAWLTAAQRMAGVSGYRFSGLDLEAVRDGAPTAAPATAATHRIPLRLREQTIGEIALQFEGEAPGAETLEIYDEIGSRLALLLENARLLQEAQNLAAREQQINAIATQARSSVNLDAILRNTVREIGLAFGASRTYIQLMPGREGVPGRDSVPTETEPKTPAAGEEN